MNDIIEELTTPKGAIILLIVIMALVGLFYTDLSGLTGASIISKSEVSIGSGDDEPISYWVIGFTQSKFETEEFRTLSTETTSGSGGVTSSEDSVKYDLEATYFLDVDSLGYSRDLSSSTTNKYVSRVFDKGGLLGGISLDHEMSKEGVNYYSLSSETWRNKANYEPVVKIIKNNKEVEYRAQRVTSTGTRYEVPNTDPTIYYEEIGLIMGSNNEGAPILSSSDTKIIPYANNKLLFVDVSDKSINEILNYPVGTWHRYYHNGKTYVSWNLALNGEAGQSFYSMRDYIDFNQNGVFDKETDLKDLDMTFDVNDLCTEEFTMYYEPLVGDIYSHHVTSFKTFEYEGISDTTKYSVENEMLFYDTPLIIFGTWHIPIEYGDFVVTESNVVPKIDKIELLPESLYEGEVATLKITASVTGNNGRVIARITNTEDIGHLIFSDKDDVKFIEIGTPQTFEFKITATEVVENFDGTFDVELEGTTGIIVSKTVNYEVKDTSNIKESDKIAIIIRAVDKNGNLLNTEYPITVSQTGTTQYGTWNGVVIKDKIFISGEETNGLFPQDKEITVTDTNTEFTLIYAEKYYVPPTDWSTIFLILIAVLAVIAIGYGVYLASKEGKKT